MHMASEYMIIYGMKKFQKHFLYLPLEHAWVNGLQTTPDGQCSHPGVIPSRWMQLHPLHLWPAGHSKDLWHWQTS